MCVTASSNFHPTNMLLHHRIKFCSTPFRKLPLSGWFMVSVEPLKAMFRSAQDWIIAPNRERTSRHLFLSASVSAISCLSMVSPFARRISFHVAMWAVCSWLSSWTLSKWLAFFQSFSPSLFSLLSFRENILQQKQCKLSLFFKYISQFFSID